MRSDTCIVDHFVKRSYYRTSDYFNDNRTDNNVTRPDPASCVNRPSWGYYITCHQAWCKRASQCRLNMGSLVIRGCEKTEYSELVYKRSVLRRSLCNVFSSGVSSGRLTQSKMRITCSLFSVCPQSGSCHARPALLKLGNQSEMTNDNL